MASRLESSPSPTRSRRPPPKPSAIFTHLGLKLVMLTGDNRRTAAAVAEATRPRCGRGGDRTRRESCARQEAARGRQSRGDGRRRHQRRSRPQRSGGRHRHGHRHRRGHAKRGHHARQRRPARHCQSHPTQSRHDAEYPAEPCSSPFVYNALGIPVAAGVLYPFFGWLLSPIIAGAAMSLSSVSVISNALRLRTTKL